MERTLALILSLSFAQTIFSHTACAVSPIVTWGLQANVNVEDESEAAKTTRLSDTCWWMAQGLASTVPTAKMNRSEVEIKIGKFASDLLRAVPTTIADGKDSGLLKLLGYESNVVSYLIKLARTTRESNTLATANNRSDQIVAFSIPFTKFRKTVRDFKVAAMQEGDAGSAASAKLAAYELEALGREQHIDRANQSSAQKYKYFRYSAAVGAATLALAGFGHFGSIDLTPKQEFAILAATFFEALVVYNFYSFARIDEDSVERQKTGLAQFKKDWDWGKLSSEPPSEDELGELLGEKLDSPADGRPYVVEDEYFDLLLPVDPKAADAEVTVIFKNQSIIEFFNKKPE